MAACTTSTSERRWLWGFATLVAILTTVPYWAGFAEQGSEWRFTGFIFGVEDGNSYIAKMVSGSYGSWLFRSPYSPYPQKGTLFFLPYILLGKLASGPALHEQLVVLYHLFRIVASYLMIHASYDFISIFIVDLLWRRIGVALATLGGGLGWILLLIGKSTWYGSIPLEFYSPEAFGFLSVFGLPHLALSRALLLWGFKGLMEVLPEVAFENIHNSKRTLNGFLRDYHVGILWLLLSLVHPVSVCVAWVVASVHWIWVNWLVCNNSKSSETSRLASYNRRLLYMYILSAPAVIYNTVEFLYDPYLRSWSAQNILKTPHPIHFLLAYGAILPLACLGCYYVLREYPCHGSLLLTWLILFPILVYLPLGVQRRFAEGIWVILTVLAIKGMSELSIWNRLPLKIVVCIAIIVSFPSTIVLWAGGLQETLIPSFPIYRRVSEVDAFEYFQRASMKDKVVLASYSTSNALAAWAPVRVIVGHGPESRDLTLFMNKVERFYSTDTYDNEKRMFLNEAKVDYVFWGPMERILGSWNPNDAPYLHRVYKGGEYEIFMYAKEK